MSTDPVTLAREVLDDERAWAALDPGHHPEGQAAVYRLANAAPTLARAVIDLTAKVERMEALEAALEKVLELHQPVTDGMGFTEHGYGGISPACGACGTSDEYAVPYPCPTVTAITTALEATK